MAACSVLRPSGAQQHSEEPDNLRACLKVPGPHRRALRVHQRRQGRKADQAVAAQKVDLAVAARKGAAAPVARAMTVRSQRRGPNGRGGAVLLSMGQRAQPLASVSVSKKPRRNSRQRSSASSKNARRNATRSQLAATAFASRLARPSNEVDSRLVPTTKVAEPSLWNGRFYVGARPSQCTWSVSSND